MRTIALGLLLVVACGTASRRVQPAAVADQEEHGDGVPNWATADVEEILRETARRSCAQHARCRSYLCAPVGVLTEVCHPARIEPRIARVLQALREGSVPPRTAVSSGTAVRFDRAAALEVLEELASDSCLAQRRSRRCDIGLDRTFDAIVGTRATGEVCRSDAVCRNARCAYDERGRGRCAAPMPDRPLVDGARECESSRDCLPGRICTQSHGCVLPLPASAPCGERGRFSACGEGLVCMDSGCGAGVPLGGACSNDGTMDPCAPDLTCDGHRCIEPGQPWAACGTGDHCPESFECRSGTCVPLPMLGQSCRDECVDSLCVSGSCQPVPLGGACISAIFGGRRCAEGGRCDLRQNQCVRDAGE